MFAVDDGDWPVLLTSVNRGPDGGGSAIGPNGRLVTASEKLSPSVNETSTLISLPTSASTGWYVSESAPTFVWELPSTRIHW